MCVYVRARMHECSAAAAAGLVIGTPCERTSERERGFAQPRSEGTNEYIAFIGQRCCCSYINARASMFSNNNTHISPLRCIGDAGLRSTRRRYDTGFKAAAAERSARSRHVIPIQTRAYVCVCVYTDTGRGEKRWQ